MATPQRSSSPSLQKFSPLYSPDLLISGIELSDFFPRLSQFFTSLKSSGGEASEQPKKITRAAATSRRKKSESTLIEQVLVIPIISLPKQDEIGEKTALSEVEQSFKNLYSQTLLTQISESLVVHGEKSIDYIEGEISTLTGKAGEIWEYALNKSTSLLFLGFGEQNPVDLRKAGVGLGRKLRGTNKKAIIQIEGAESGALLFLNAFALSQYQWNMRAASPTAKLPQLEISGVSQAALEKSRSYYTGVWRARNLIHTPSNIKTPLWIANETKKLVAKANTRSLTLDVKAGIALKEFGGLVAVGKSSPKPGPRLIELSYRPTGSTAKTLHVVIVGKGITFDTGGISLKRPYEFMTAMKSDMAGAAAAISTVLTVAELNLNVRVTALAMCAENALSGTSTRPSDVVTHYGGQTDEIINTDAEGRLVLADGLAYAVDKLEPDYLIDIATLTGAATLGLSRHYGALYTRSNELARQLVAAGEHSGERLWHMPLVDDYEIALSSEIADMNHAADKFDFSGGSVTAALFLEKFSKPSAIVNKAERTAKTAVTKNKKAPLWAHLDIAGPARSEVDAGENVKGGTGFGVRVLSEWISSL